MDLADRAGYNALGIPASTSQGGVSCSNYVENLVPWTKGGARWGVWAPHDCPPGDRLLALASGHETGRQAVEDDARPPADDVGWAGKAA